MKLSSMKSILTALLHDTKVFNEVEQTGDLFFSYLFIFLAYSHCKQQNVLVFARVVSIFGPLLKLERRLISKLIAFHFCVLKMFVHPDGASTTVPVTLQAKNVKHGPTQV